MVYHCCLFVGEVALNVESETKSSLPYVPLLRICKAVKLEAEPVVYKNTFILPGPGAIEDLFDRTFASPARKLLLKSVKISLGNHEYISKDRYWPIRNCVTKRILISIPPTTFSERTWRAHRLDMKECEMIWKRKVVPILENLTLDRLVLDLGDSFCQGGCKCRMAATALTCFKEGFASRAPNVVEIKGWDAVRDDIETVVRDCLQIWTMKRARRVAGSLNQAQDVNSEAEKWLLEAARSEEKN